MIRSQNLLVGMVVVALIGFLFFGFQKEGFTQIEGVSNYTESQVVVPHGSSSFGRGVNGFGPSIDSYGNTVVFGASGERANDDIQKAGRVYIFERDADDNLFFYQRIQSSNPQEGEYFGVDVSIHGNRIAIGAYHISGDNIGKVYIFEKNELGFWTEVEIITASDGEVNNNFGICVSLEEDTLIVGANGTQIGTFPTSGAGYVYERDGDGVWNETVLRRIDPGELDVFGFNCAVSGDYAVVGAPAANDFRGYADFYEKDELGNWNHVQRATRSEGEPWDVFGWDVEIDGNTAIIGAPQAYKDPSDITGILGIGTAFIYERDSSGTWNPSELRIDNNFESYYGQSVEISGNRALIGAYGSINENESEGNMYEYEKDSNGRWILKNFFHPSIEDVTNLGNRVSFIDNIYMASAREKSPVGALTVYLFKAEEEIPSINVANLDPPPVGGVFSNVLASDATPNSEVVFIRGTRAQIFIDDRICPELETGIRNYRIIDTVESDATGSASARFRIPRGWDVGRVFYVQAVDVATCTVSNLVMETVVPPNPTTFVLNQLNPPPVAGLYSTSTASESTSNSDIVFLWGNKARVTSGDSICPGLQLGITGPRIIDTVQSDVEGTASAEFRVPSGWDVGREFYMQAVDLATCSASNVVLETVIPPLPPTFVLNPLDPSPIAGLVSELNSTEATGNSEIVYIRGRRAGTFSDNRICPGLQTGIRNYRIIDTAISDPTGQAFYFYEIPSGLAGKEYSFQAVDLSTCTASNVVTEFIEPVPEGDLVFGEFTRVGASTYEANISNAAPGREIAIFQSPINGMGNDPSEVCENLDLDIIVHIQHPSVFADESGEALFSFFTPASNPLPVYFQAVDVDSCRKSNLSDLITD